MDVKKGVGLKDEVGEVKKRLWRDRCLGKIIGRSRSIQELHGKILRLSSCKVSVLITGESGTGKELVARALHYLSQRAGKPFIPVNCGAIPDTLFENELFGHRKGAFTNACLNSTGLIQEAEGGTLFLDEIGSVSPYAQVKLLRFLQNREYKPLGDPMLHKADVRVIAATNKDIFKLVREGAFREDLYYRLNIVSIHIPPLRERMEDIPLLVGHFIDKYSKEYNKEVTGILDDVMQMLLSRRWAGNVRELESMVQHMVVMSSSSVVSAEDIEVPTCETTSTSLRRECFKDAKKCAVEEFEKRYLTRLLTEFRGDMVRAATWAGKSRTALWNLLKKHDLSPKMFRSPASPRKR